MGTNKESFVYLFTKIITAVIGMVTLSVQTRLISPDALGIFSIITGLTGVIVALFITWLSSSALRYYLTYQKKDELPPFYTTLTANWVIMVSACLISFVFISMFVKSIPLMEYLPYCAAFIVAASIFEIVEKLMRVSGRYISYCVLLFMQSLLNLAVIVGYNYITGQQTETLFVSKILTNVLFCTFAISLLKFIPKLSFKSYSKDINKTFFKYGMPMIGVWGVSWLLNYSDRYMINFFNSTYDVGLYTVAYGFAETTIGLIVSAFNLAFFPELIRSWENNGKSGAEIAIKSNFEYLFMLTLPAVVGLSLLSKQFYGTLIDVQYKEAAVVIPITSIGFFFMGINNVLYKLWQLEEKTTKVLYLTIASVAFNIIANMIFIPLYGYTAAAIATTASYILTTVIAVISLYKKYKLRLDFIFLVRLFVSLIVISTFLLLVRDQISDMFGLLLYIVAAACVYLGVLFLCGGLRNEWQSLKNKVWRHRR